MSRAVRDRDPVNRSPHPPGRDRPVDIARRKFKLAVDQLMKEFMSGDEKRTTELDVHLLWALTNPGPTSDRSAYIMLVNFIMKKAGI